MDSTRDSRDFKSRNDFTLLEKIVQSSLTRVVEYKYISLATARESGKKRSDSVRPVKEKLTMLVPINRMVNLRKIPEKARGCLLGSTIKLARFNDHPTIFLYACFLFSNTF